MLKRLWRGWQAIAKTIGRVQSAVILALTYYVVMAPFAIAARLFGDPLGLAAGPAWRTPERQPGAATPLDNVRQQF